MDKVRAKLENVGTHLIVGTWTLEMVEQDDGSFKAEEAFQHTLDYPAECEINIAFDGDGDADCEVRGTNRDENGFHILEDEFGKKLNSSEQEVDEEGGYMANLHQRPRRIKPVIKNQTKTVRCIFTVRYPTGGAPGLPVS